MSKREPAANASSSGVAPRRSSTGSRGAERTATEEGNRRGRVGSRGAGGGWREPAGAAQATAAGRREPPLCFGVKNDVVGAVIGERGRRPGSLRDGAAASGLQQRGAQFYGGQGRVRGGRTSWKTRAASSVKVFPVSRRGAAARCRGPANTLWVVFTASVLYGKSLSFVTARGLAGGQFNCGKQYAGVLDVQFSTSLRCILQ